MRKSHLEKKTLFTEFEEKVQNMQAMRLERQETDQT